MPVEIGNVKIYVGPKETGGPDDLKKAIIDFIDGAQRYLDIAVQELDNWEIADAIIRARQRKVTVNIVKEADYLRSTPGLKDPYTPGGSLEANREINNALNRANINVKTDYNTSIFHQKFIIRDRSALLTGSTNFTTTGVTKNLNHIVTVENIDIAKIYRKEYNEIMQGHFGKLNEGHDEAPKDIMVDNVPVRILFAPDHNPEMEIMKQMLKASSSIDFAIFTFSQSSGIDDTMIAQSERGLKIRGALDGKAANQVWAATRPVKNAGADLYAIPSSSVIGKLHHKLMVLDGQVIIAGSFNYTGPANRLNDENIIILGDLECDDPQVIKNQKELGKYALNEIERIIGLGNKID